MNALQKRPPTGLTIPEFLSWAASVDGRWELRDGRPEMMDPASDRHGGIQSELAYMLTAHLRLSGVRCRVATAPGVVPRARAGQTMLIPDIGVTCAPPSFGVPFPDPAVLIEILSPSNEAQTRANLRAFATIPSVVEIVLVSSVQITAEILRRRPDGSWPDRSELIGSDGRLSLTSIGFDAPLRDAYRTTVLGADLATGTIPDIPIGSDA